MNSRQVPLSKIIKYVDDICWSCPSTSSSYNHIEDSLPFSATAETPEQQFLERGGSRRPPWVMVKAVPLQQWCSREVQESVWGLWGCHKLCDCRSALRHIMSPTRQSLSSVSTCTSRILQLKSFATLFVHLLIATSAQALVCVVAETGDSKKHQV